MFFQMTERPLHLLIRVENSELTETGMKRWSFIEWCDDPSLQSVFRLPSPFF